MDEAIDDFRLYIASEKGLTPDTVTAYHHDATVFATFLAQQGICTFEQVEQCHLVAFLDEMNKKGYASATLCRTLITLKVLFRFCKREGYVSVNHAHYLSTPKLWQLIPDVLTGDEVEQLLAVPDTTCHVGCRDRAILEVLYASGLRVSELCNLTIYSIDDTYIRVMGKGRKERIVPIGKQALAAVDQYLIHYRSRFDSEENQTLFLSQKGSALDRVAVWRVVVAHARRAAIDKKVSPHTLRHSFATHLLDNGADLRIIQELLGHASITSTDRYTHVSHSRLQAAFNMFHPRQASEIS